jgi:uncharacterized membrane protein YcaP (DUF421 family)
MQLPDRGLLFGIVALICAYIFQRGINLWAFKNARVEGLTQGHLSLLVKDGQLNVKELSRTKVTRQQLYAMLREQQIYNLGNLERVYLEACGLLSVYKANDPKPGLPISPGSDPAILQIQEKVDPGIVACTNCGHVQRIKDCETPCEVCHAVNWSKAYLEKA